METSPLARWKSSFYRAACVRQNSTVCKQLVVSHKYYEAILRLRFCLLLSLLRSLINTYRKIHLTSSRLILAANFLASMLCSYLRCWKFSTVHDRKFVTELHKFPSCATMNYQNCNHELLQIQSDMYIASNATYTITYVAAIIASYAKSH